MRLSAWTATFTSVARRSSVCERSPSPITCFHLPMAASARARLLYPDRHCQVGGLRGALDHVAALRWRSRRHLGAGLLPPHPEGLGAGAAVPGGAHQVPPRTEVAVDHGVRREEPLGLLGRLEPLHLALS